MNPFEKRDRIPRTPPGSSFVDHDNTKGETFYKESNCSLYNETGVRNSLTTQDLRRYTITFDADRSFNRSFCLVPASSRTSLNVTADVLLKPSNGVLCTSSPNGFINRATPKRVHPAEGCCKTPGTVIAANRKRVESADSTENLPPAVVAPSPSDPVNLSNTVRRRAHQQLDDLDSAKTRTVGKRRKLGTGDSVLLLSASKEDDENSSGASTSSRSLRPRRRRARVTTPRTLVTSASRAAISLQSADQQLIPTSSTSAATAEMSTPQTVVRRQRGGNRKIRVVELSVDLQASQTQTGWTAGQRTRKMSSSVTIPSSDSLAQGTPPTVVSKRRVPPPRRALLAAAVAETSLWQDSENLEEEVRSVSLPVARRQPARSRRLIVCTDETPVATATRHVQATVGLESNDQLPSANEPISARLRRRTTRQHAAQSTRK